jgi:hypothetical protein
LLAALGVQGAVQPDEKTLTLLERLAPTERAQLIMALLAVILLGVLVVAMVLVGGHRLRRIARSRPRQSRPGEDDWSRKPLVSPDKDQPPTTPASS